MPSAFVPPRHAEHPGVHLRDALTARGISGYRLTKATGMASSRVTAILQGKRAVNADAALRIGRALGTSPEFWMHLQTAYDLYVAGQADAAAYGAIEALPGIAD